MTTQEFVASLNEENLALAEKMQACKTPEEAYAIAQEAGLSVDFDTFAAEMTSFYESVKDLSDDDLDNVAGGADSVVVATSIVGSLATSAAIGSLAAVAASI